MAQLQNGDRPQNDKTIVPYGLYVVAFFLCLGLATMLFRAMSIPGYRIPLIIDAPLIFYAAIGTIRRWRWAWHLLVVLLWITLGVAVLNFVVLFSSDAAVNFTSEELLGIVAQNGLRVLMLPFMLAYILGKGVRTYVAGTT